MKEVARFSKPEEAHLAASILEGNGIRAFVRDSNISTMNWLYTAAVGGVRLEVFDQEIEKAREVLGTQTEASILLKCPYCSSSNTRIRELSLLVALILGVFGFILPKKSVCVDCMDCGKSWKRKNCPTQNQLVE